MAVLSKFARQKKIEYFFKGMSLNKKILEIGCADGWLGQYLKNKGYNNYIGLDIIPPADIIGDIREWEKLGIKKESYDVIIAFEVIEHVDCFKECFDILKPGGKLMITTPLPNRDWILKIFETFHLNQKRTSPHENLTYLKNIKLFKESNIKIVGSLSQWGIFTK